MAERIRVHLRSNLIGFLALFFALTGGVAWATHPGGANTISSGDIINGEVKSVDVGTGEIQAVDIANGAVNGAKLAPNSINSANVLNESLTGADVANNSSLGPAEVGGLGGADIADAALGSADLANLAVTMPKLADLAVSTQKLADSAVTSAKVQNDTLTGADIDESTLSAVPSTPTGPAGGDLAGAYPDPAIAAGAVGIGELAFDPATQSELDNLATDDGDPPNAGSNLLHWSRLVGVPAEVVDGDDVGWELTGNAGTSGAEDFLGTTDDQPLNLRVNNARALRLEPASNGTGPSPNVIGGIADNSVADGAYGATIGGGGRSDPGDPSTANEVTDSYGTIGGGADNQAGDDSGTVDDEPFATVGGGVYNTASGFASTAVGGYQNTAEADFSLAGGTFAKANHFGAIVWADALGADFTSTAANQFSVRSTGGTRLVSGIDGSGNPTSGLELPADTSGLSTLVTGQPFDVRVNGSRGMRIDPASDGTNQSPNLIGGTASNSVTAGVHSATIAGGGRGVPANPATANRVTDSQGTVGGGANNQAGNNAGTIADRTLATVGGGGNNTASGEVATVAGGFINTASGNRATVAGGENNTASGLRSTVGGGLLNSANGLRATVGGGQSNSVGAAGTDATISGGANSFASGIAATIPGGFQNEAQGDYSLAAGRRAQAQAAHDGAFVWADSNDLLFPSTAANQFSVRATGGTRLVTGVNGSGAITSGLELPGGTTALSTLVNGSPFDIRVNGARGLRIDPASDGTNQSPNVIGGSADNSVTAGVHSATIGGGGRSLLAEPGSANRITDDQGTIGGGAGNRAGDSSGTTGDRTFATVGGGGNNLARGEAATVGGGFGNGADGSRATVAGGEANAATGLRATVGGGQLNRATAETATVAGGQSNTAGALRATVGGGLLNSAGGNGATVAGGSTNIADASGATVGGGSSNTAGQAATVAGGVANIATGSGATVVGGTDNQALGDLSLAGGTGARVGAGHNGAFVWAGSDPFQFASTTANEFSVRSTGGARFVSAIDGAGTPTAGVTLAPGGGSWSSLSDEASKRAIEPVSGRGVLRALADVPISTWSYRAQDESIRHMGPMAQDFFDAFGVGEDRRRISTVDADGVALAAIQGLNRKVERLQRKLAELD